jgi:serine/threonine protein kinase
MDLTVENVCGLLIRGGLLTVDDVKATYGRWLAEAKGAAADVGQFTRWLIANQVVTEYQAALVARGRTEGLFLNDYKILDRLGLGRMVGLFKAVHPLGQVVAIKVLLPAQAKASTILARFQREARLAMGLKHPNVVRTFQVGEAGGIHYLVMECLEGETLDEVLNRRGRLPPAEGVRLIYQALQGLQHLHEQGRVHGGLKPASLMLVPPFRPAVPDTTLQATVKLLDAGLARVLLDEWEERSEGQAAPDAAYRAPELAGDGRAGDIRADIFSLGCILYQVLGGRPPFATQARSASEGQSRGVPVGGQGGAESPPSVQELNPAVPDALQQIVNWMIAKDPNGRYPTPERAAQALHVFLAAGSEPLSSGEAENRLQSYLSWLEMANRPRETAGTGSGEPSAVHAAPPAVPGVAPAAADRPLRPVPVEGPAAKPTTDASARSSESRRKHHAKKLKPQPQSRVLPSTQAREPTKAESPPTWDVELVPAVPMQQIVMSIRGLVLSRRDLLMLGLGAGSVATAGLIGMAIAQLNHRKKKARSHETPDPEDASRGSDDANAAAER